MMDVTTRYATRSLGRNSRRTVLSVIGIAVGCALALTMESINRGRDELFARVGAESGIGHLRVVPAGWEAQRDVRLRLADGERDLETVRRLPGIVVATPRVRADALLAMGTHTVPVEIVGVDPDTEPRAFRYVRTPTQGRYLRPGERGAVVVGKTILERLDAVLGDEILVSSVGRGGRIESTMLTIVGVVTTGSQDIDATICQAVVADVAQLTDRPGLGEVTAVVADWRRTDAIAAAVAARIDPRDRVVTWDRLSPELRGHLSQDQAISRFVSGIILFIVTLGVASAQLAAVLDRRRELAVLAALGTGSWRLVRIMLTEALILGALGAVVGLVVAAPLLLYLGRSGLDLRALAGATWSFEGTLMEPIIYGHLGLWILPYVLTVALGASLLAALYPAWFTARTDPATALRAVP